MEEKPKKKISTALIIVIVLVAVALLVACVVGIILSLGIFGAGLAQTSSRDVQRRNTLDSISLGVESYFEFYGKYPESINFSSDNVNIGNLVDVPLVGVDQMLSLNEKDAVSTTEGSVYCYEGTDDGFILGVLLESGTWFEMGNDPVGTCEAKYGN